MSKLAELCKEHKRLKAEKAEVTADYNGRIKELEQQIYILAEEEDSGQTALFRDGAGRPVTIDPHTGELDDEGNAPS